VEQYSIEWATVHQTHVDGGLGASTWLNTRPGWRGSCDAQGGCFGPKLVERRWQKARVVNRKPRVGPAFLLSVTDDHSGSADIATCAGD